MAGLGVGALLLWLVRIWVKPDFTLLWPPVAWAVVAFLIYAVLRGHEAVLEYTARGELLQIALYGTVFFVTLNNLNRQHSANWVAGALIAVATFAAMYALSQLLTKSGHVWHFVRSASYAGRGSGTYICPNHLAGLLEIALPLALAYLLSGRLGHLARILLGYAVLVMIAGLVSTESRGGWAAAALSLLVLLAVLLGQRGQRLPALIVLVLLTVAAGWIVSEVKTTSTRVEKAFNPDKLDDPRFNIWPAAVKIWQANFWWGAGPGHFDPLFRLHRDGVIKPGPATRTTTTSTPSPTTAWRVQPSWQAPSCSCSSACSACGSTSSVKATTSARARATARPSSSAAPSRCSPCCCTRWWISTSTSRPTPRPRW